jgi:FlaA1/EpsC-like NDP-sugar epimerase
MSAAKGTGTVGTARLRLVDDRADQPAETAASPPRPRDVNRVLLLCDVVAIALAAVASALLFGAHVAPLLLALPLWLVIARAQGLYGRRGVERESLRILQVMTVAVWPVVAGIHLAGADPNLHGFVAFWLAAACLVLIARTGVRAGRSRELPETILIVGAGEVGQLIARDLIAHRAGEAEVVGFVDSRPKARRPDLPEHLTVLGPSSQVDDIVKRLGVERVVVTPSSDPGSGTVELVRALNERGVRVELVASVEGWLARPFKRRRD